MKICESRDISKKQPPFNMRKAFYLKDFRGIHKGHDVLITFNPQRGKIMKNVLINDEDVDSKKTFFEKIFLCAIF